MAVEIGKRQSSPPSAATSMERTPCPAQLRGAIEGFLRPRLSRPEIADGTLADLVGDAVAAVLARLADDQSQVIGDLTAYSRQVAQHKLDDHVRRLRPNYWSVQSSIRYFCSKNIGIVRWALVSTEVVSFSQDATSTRLGARVEALANTVSQSLSLTPVIGTFDAQRRGDILCRLLGYVRGPIPLDLAVRAICLAQGLNDSRLEPMPPTELASDP